MKICGLHVWIGYNSLSQKYQGTLVQILIALNGIVLLLVKL